MFIYFPDYTHPGTSCPVKLSINDIISICLIPGGVEAANLKHLKSSRSACFAVKSAAELCHPRNGYEDQSKVFSAANSNIWADTHDCACRHCDVVFCH